MPELPENEYYHYQLIGILVKDESGNNIGALSEILVTGANDVYVVTTEDTPVREILIPAIQLVILDVNLASGIMRVHLLSGLVDNDESAEEMSAD